jgi:multidrug resistance efflux pump
MPNNHPNKVQLRPKISIWTQLFHFWPLLVWGLVIAFCFWAQKQSVVFRRMNAAVDVDPQSVAPPRNGYLLDFEKGIIRGSKVKKDEIVAYMSSDEDDDKKTMLLKEILLEKEDKIRDLDRDIAKYKLDRIEFSTKQTAAQGEAEVFQQSVANYAKADQAQQDAFLRQMQGASKEDIQRVKDNPFINPETTKALAEKARSMSNSSSYKAGVDQINKVIEDLELQKTVIEKVNVDVTDNTKSLEDLRTQLSTVATAGQKMQIENLIAKRLKLTLRAPIDGVVDRITKARGQYVKAEESILKIVGEATQIVAFLPQDQLTSIKEGTKVWLTPSGDRRNPIESTIHYLAPRMNTVPDAASPIPNKRLFGRDVVIDYPKGCGLLPGQTIIVHLEDPRNIPVLSEFINSVFANDDLK